MKSHTAHQNFVSIEMRAKRNYDSNIRPFIIQWDMIFLENGVIENHDKFQSEHWLTVPYTILSYVTKWLLAIEWK